MTAHFANDFAFEPDDTSGLCAWTDDDGRFFAVGEDGIAREYGDGPDEAARLARDMLPPRERAADAPPLPAIRPCRLRQPASAPDLAEVIAGRVALAACFALTALMIVHFALAWWAGRL